jgi:indole-3-glycerol phosphate synthase
VGIGFQGSDRGSRRQAARDWLRSMMTYINGSSSNIGIAGAWLGLVIRISVLISLAVPSSYCFNVVRGNGIVSVWSRPGHRSLDMIGELSPATTLIRKAKLKEVQDIKSAIVAEGVDHVISQFLDKRQRPFGVGEPIKFKSAISSTKFNSISVLVEYNKKAKTGFILGLPPPEIMGGVIRDTGAKAVVVSLEKRTGGAVAEEVERFCREQTRARLELPGPIPIVWNDYIVDSVQVQHAAAMGAAAVTIYEDFFETEAEYQAVITECRSQNIEPIIMIKSIDEANRGLKAGATVFTAYSLDEADLLALRKQLPNDPANVYMARLRPEGTFSVYSEIDTSWTLRDSGFQGVWPSPEGVYATGLPDVYPNVAAMRSKASRKYLSPRQFLMDRKKEGAQEYLGDILY